MDLLLNTLQTVEHQFQTVVWPPVSKLLQTYNLPTNFAELRQDVNNMCRPFTHRIEQELEYFVKDYNITYLELVIFSFFMLYAVRFLFQLVKCQKKSRDYRQTTDLTQGSVQTWVIQAKSDVFQFFYRNVGPFRNYIDKQLDNAKQDFVTKMSAPFEKQCFSLPKYPLRLEKIQERLQNFYETDEKITEERKITGTRYCAIEYEEKMKDFVKEYIFHNPLHASEFPGSRQMESEIIKITCKLFGSDRDFGITTQGGTESIMMGILAHRNYYQQHKNIAKPNIIMPISAHVAFNKACYYYNIEPIVVPVKQDGAVCLKAVRKAINKNTVCIVGSNPGFPAGIQDDIPALGQIALKHNIGLHVDCCLGSFIMPFARELGCKDIKEFDFKVPGVTTISVDHHKYGMAPKGISMCMFKSADLRQAAYFSYSEWPGGLYATAQPAGSRSSAPIAGAWFALMYNGVEGYKENAKTILKTLNIIKSEINKNIPELEILGNPEVMVIAFKFTEQVIKEKKISIYQLDNEMHTKGWTMAGLQKPNSVHVALTLPFCENTGRFVKDLKASVKAIMEDPSLHKTSTSGSVGLYGASGQIPDSTTKAKVLMQIVDTFTSLRYDNNNGSNTNKTQKKSSKKNN